jgi:DNA-binding MarR family transcriptional regulator/GNAT superfamily N-acetyltransferase
MTDLARVRSFNRVTTARIGALHDEYLGQQRPLGASRVLWEIGTAGADVRAIRDRLDLDSGYLSRLLRRLEADGLVRVETDPGDRRARIVRLTPAGTAESAELDRRSDDLARSLLAPLSKGQRARLVDAMATVERLLTAGLVDIAPEDPASAATQYCWESYFAEIDARFEHGYDPAAAVAVNPQDLVEPAGVLLLARLRGEPIGCGCLLLHGPGPGDIKRLWVAPDARGLGLGRRLLAELEGYARRYGASAVRLDTNKRLTEAIALYRANGYLEVPRFSDEGHAHHWFQKSLVPTDDLSRDS